MASDLPDALRPGPLAAVLRQSNAIGRGATVRAVELVSDRTTTLSRIIQIRVKYDGEAPNAPGSLIYKTSHPDRAEIGWNAGRHEVNFYRAATDRSRACLPVCFEAVCDEAARTWHLLIEDLSATHTTSPGWPLPPPIPVCETIVDVHARHQAAFWDDQQLDALGAGWWRWQDEAAASAYLERLGAQIDGFAERLGDRLSPERRDFFRRLVDGGLRLARRYLRRGNLTLVQGDAHAWNCFLPRDRSSDARLFDWDSWRIDIGASDLAYLMAVHWYPERRRLAERHLLDRYHAGLTRAGVRGYERDALAADYRLAVLWQTVWPVSQEAYGIPPVIWWNNLERIFLAVEDLGCTELFDR